MNTSNIFAANSKSITFQISKKRFGKQIYFILISFVCLFYYSCEDDNNLNGKVFNLQNQPLSNVSIIHDGKIITKSEDDGSFKLPEGEIEDGDILIFKEEGAVTISRKYKSDLFLDIFMKERNESVFVNANDTIILPSGVELRFPENPFQINDKRFDGVAKITATYFNPNNSSDLISVPAQLISIDEKGNQVPLSTFGMIEILAVTEDDIQLDLNKGKSIGITMPLDESNLINERGVNLYSLDPSVGFWNYTGNMQIVNNQLLGEITSVNSAWNADEPCSDQLICVTVNVQFSNGNPGCGIGAEGITYQGFDGLYLPDQNGDVQLTVCPNSVFELGACWLTCCGPGVPQSDPCCNNPQHKKTIDLSTVTINPTGCTDLGVWNIQN